jgi:hypothetical protein
VVVGTTEGLLGTDGVQEWGDADSWGEPVGECSG